MKIKLLIIILITFSLISLVHSSIAQDMSIFFEQKSINGYTMDIVWINLRDPRVLVLPIVPNNRVAVKDIIVKHKPTTAINGTYFDRKTFLPVSDIMIDKKTYTNVRLGTAMGITSTNEIEFRDAHEKKNYNWSYDFTHVLVGGPRLLRNGEITVYPTVEGFTYGGGIFGKRNRSCVATTASGYLAFITIKQGIYLSDLAKILKITGFSNAMNLDGGSSSLLYYRGSMVTGSQGLLANNVLAAYEKADFWWERWKSYIPDPNW